MATLDNLISQQSSLIESALSTARETTSRIANVVSPALLNPNLRYTFDKPTLSKPPSFGEILPGDTSGSTIQFLDAEVDKLVEQYFPELNACFKDTPERWCCGIITGATPLGLSQDAFDLVWHQGRDRESRSRTAEVRNIAARFSASGFTLPPGAMLAAIAQAEERASDAVSDVNRTQTVRDLELKWEMLKFAEEQAIHYKLGMMRLVAEMYNFFLQVPARDVDVFRAKAQAYAASQDALSSFYRVELGFEELRMRAAEVRLGGDISNDRNRIASSQGTSAASALATAARGFTDTASAAANAQSALIADLNAGES